jgi:hypothetical protein
MNYNGICLGGSLHGQWKAMDKPCFVTPTIIYQPNFVRKIYVKPPKWKCRVAKALGLKLACDAPFEFQSIMQKEWYNYITYRNGHTVYGAWLCEGTTAEEWSNFVEAMYQVSLINEGRKYATKT